MSSHNDELAPVLTDLRGIATEFETITDFLRWSLSAFSANELFFGHGTDNAWDEAVHLILQALHLPLDIDKQLLDARLSLREREHLVGLLERRIIERVPVPYLVNQAWFNRLPFVVDSSVLIPRSPIGELIEQRFSPWLKEGQPVQRILDLCTGSGCIGIACAYEFEDAQVDLSDISTAALSIAEKNVLCHGLEERVSCIQSDLFSALNVDPIKYDLIVSNPPYVDANDLHTMPPEFHHEPRLALAAGEDGLDIAKRILVEAAHYLSEDGVLVLEVGNSGQALEECFADIPFTWLEFDRGGFGVFVFTAEELKRYF